MCIYTQIDGFFQSKFRISESGDILRGTQISNFLKILQILNGYLNRIAFLNLVSNHNSEKWGFGEINRANP